jgi:hypothetical protein
MKSKQMPGPMTKHVLETALDAEMTEHLGYESTTRPATAAATPATAPGPKRCSAGIDSLGPSQFIGFRDRSL